MITHRYLHLHLLVKGDGQHSSGVGGPMNNPLCVTDQGDTGGRVVGSDQSVVRRW